MKVQFSLNQILAITSGQGLSEHEIEFAAIGTDTRRDLSGQVFLALAGDQFDGHDFLLQAKAQGAIAFIVHQDSQEVRELSKTHTVVLVKDTLMALQKLGKFWRQQMTAKIVGITGSNGKTTTKECAARICSTQVNTHFSKGSYNNHWGVPFSLLELNKSHEVGLFEMGMNALGEIDNLCKIAEPDVVVVTNVGTSHIGELGSQENIAKAKEEIYLAAPDYAQFIFNLDNEFTMEMYHRAQSKTANRTHLTFSAYNDKADVKLRADSVSVDGLVVRGRIDQLENKVTVPMFGRHNVNNLMAAACIGLACGVTPENIWKGMTLCRSNWGRNQLVKLATGRAIFDGYNANQESMNALIRNLYEIELPEGAQKFAIFGEMLELGELSTDMHKRLGETVGQSDFHSVYFFGPHSAAFAEGFNSCESDKNLMISDSYEESLALKIKSMLNDQDIVILKGSRGMKLENALNALDPVDFN